MEAVMEGPAVQVRTPRDRTTFSIVSITIAAWAFVILARASGWSGSLGNHQLIDRDGASWLALGLFLLGWLVMVAAMMFPSSLPTFRRLARAIVPDGRTPASLLVLILGGYLLVWVAVGWAGFVADIGIHRLQDSWPWLTARPRLIGGATLVLAGGFELSRFARDGIDRAQRQDAAPPEGRLRPAVALRLGADHGLQRLSRCWPLMLVSFGVGMASLVWMGALTAFMTLEPRPGWQRTAIPSAGAALLVLGVLVLANPTWLPAVLSRPS